MKKKFLAIYALTGALVASPVFTSCVDDNESASVTAVRNAKAEQLKGLAALANAQAQAETIRANAEAKLNEAKAAHQQALADATAAEKDRADQVFAAQLEQIKAEAEQAMWLAKKQAAEYEQQFNDAADEHVKTLYGNLQTEVGNLNTLLKKQINKKKNLAALEAGIITTEEYAKIQNASYDKTIAQKEFEISLYDKYEGADLTKLKQDKATAERDLNKLGEPMGELQNSLNEANNAYYEKLNEYNYFNSSSNSPLATLKAANTLNNIWSSYGNIAEAGTKDLTDDHSITYYTLNTAKVDIKKAELEKEIRDRKQELGVPAAAATETTAAVKATGLYKDIEDWNANIDTEKENIKDWEAQLAADPTLTYLQGQIDNANANIQRYNNYIDDINNIQIPTATLNLKNAEANLEAFEAAVKSFDAESEDWKAYEAAIAAQTTLAKAIDTAKKAKDTAQEAYDAKEAEITALNNLISNSTDVESIIAGLQQNIVYWKQQKQANLNSVSDKAAQIAQAEEQLKTYETQITAQKAIIANLEAAIKAAIGEPEA
ncbi:hypothetical protein [Phocaeicola sp.]